MTRDLHNNINLVESIDPVAVGTTGTGQTGAVVDRRGYDSVEAAISYGAVTATGAVFTVTMMEGDVTGTMTSVADADLIGTELAAGLAATTPRVDGTSENMTKRLGYRGNQRYVGLNISSTVTAGTPVAASFILGNAHRAPVAT